MNRSRIFLSNHPVDIAAITPIGDISRAANRVLLRSQKTYFYRRIALIARSQVENPTRDTRRFHIKGNQRIKNLHFDPKGKSGICELKPPKRVFPPEPQTIHRRKYPNIRSLQRPDHRLFSPGPRPHGKKAIGHFDMLKIVEYLPYRPLCLTVHLNQTRTNTPHRQRNRIQILPFIYFCLAGIEQSGIV